METDEELAQPLPPWHMWGNGELITVDDAVGVAVTPRVSQQIARINYKRPETWTFWIGAKLTGGAENLGVGDGLVRLIVDIIPGVGRSSFLTAQNQSPLVAIRPAFVDFHWVVPAGAIPGQSINNVKYTTTAITPPLDDRDAETVRTVEWFPAQDIQCEATLIKLSADIASVTAEVTAFFAPRTHVRPDWFARVPKSEQFRGGETEGR